MSLAMEASDESFTAWQRGNLFHAAGLFDVRVVGPPVLGWRLRSIGAPAVHRAEGKPTAGDPGGSCWLRVVSDYPEWASGDGWTGTADAHELDGLAIPRVLRIAEWEDDGRRQRAEASTRLPGTRISSTETLHRVAALPEPWWAELRATLDRMNAAPTTRIHTEQSLISEGVQGTLGRDVRVHRWETVHGDLHWANLLAEPFGLLDLELWGRGPAGLDPATLYCHSLLTPPIAEKVRATFRDALDSPDGRRAQLIAGARILARIATGDPPEVAGPLRAHLHWLRNT